MRPARNTRSVTRTCIELLDAGIDVFTTLDVQHIESRAEAVAQISGAVVREMALPAGFESAIFARFHRGPDAKPGGLGLGLSIAQRLATALGAKLGGENLPGGGACFTLRIPIGGELKLPA